MSSKKVLLLVGIFILLCFSVALFSFWAYSRAVSKNIQVKYYPPLETNKNLKYGEVVFLSDYPVVRTYFLKNIKFFPQIKGDFYFQNEVKYFFGKKAFKKIKFVPKNVERNSSYKIFFLGKEFVFSVPVPRSKRVLFNKEKNQIEITFFEPVDEKYFFEEFKLEPDLQGTYVFSDSNKKVIFIPKKIKEDVNYIGVMADKKISFRIDSAKVEDVYFDQNDRELVITTSKPIEEDKLKENFETKPVLKGDFIFNDTKDKIIFKPKSLKADQVYEAKILNEKIKFEYSSVRVKNLYFDKDKQEVTIVFTGPIKESKFFDNFEISPKIDGKFTFDAEKNWVVFKPQKMKIGQLYTITILGSRISFKIYYISSGQSYDKSKYIDINLSSQTMRLYQGGKIVSTYQISSGRPGMETPTGTFHILSKSRLLWSTKYSLYMPYSLRFYNGYFIHELPYWPGGYREGQWHLGIPVSHGCVRLGIGPAERVFNFTNIGTKVIIHY